MRIRYVFLIGLVLSLITMTVLANRFKNGDIDDIVMYIVTFLAPVIFVVILNTLFIMYLSTFKNSTSKLLISFLPLCLFILVSLMRNLAISSIDGNLAVLALTEAIAIGITNLIWIVSVYKQKSLGNNESQEI